MSTEITGIRDLCSSFVKITGITGSSTNANECTKQAATRIHI